MGKKKKKQIKESDAAIENNSASGADASVVLQTEIIEISSVDGDANIQMEANTDSTSETPTEEARFLVTNLQQIEQVLEAIIFAAPKAMSLIRLRNLLNHFNYDTAQLSSVLDGLIEASKDKGFQLVKVAGGYQYRSHPEHSEVLQKLLEDKPARLSTSALEVLAIIAYKQPVTRGDIDSVRGVDSGHLLKGLLEKDLVRNVGHAETAGRPLLYGTTNYFLEVFTLGSLDDLAQMDEIKRELNTDGDGTLDAALGIDSSGLAANPDRGQFDQIPEEIIENPDFGLQDRAREELA
jgi:segregation and condensation protein B